MIQNIVSLDEKFTESVTNALIALEREYGVALIDRGDVRQVLASREPALQSEGISILGAIRDWIKQDQPGKAIERVVDDMVEAATMIERKDYGAAVITLEKSAGLIVRNIDYSPFSLQEAALLSCLVSELLELAEAVQAPQARHLAARSRCNVADDALRNVAKGEGDVQDFLPLLAELYFKYRQKLGFPRTTSAVRLRALMLEGVDSADLPGIAVAIWAATHGHLVELNDPIVARIAEIESDRSSAESSSECEQNEP